MCGANFTGKRNDSLFCSNTCKAKYWKKIGKEKTRLGGVTYLENMNTINSEKTEIPVTKETYTNDRELIFTNVIDTTAGEITGMPPAENGNPTKEDINQDRRSKTKGENLLPPLVEKTIWEDNPTYIYISSRLSDCRKNITICENELSNIEEKVKAWNSPTGNSLFTIGVSSGALLGYNLGSTENNPKRKQKKPQQDNRLLFALLGGLLGLGASALIKSASEGNKEQAKKAALQELSRLYNDYKSLLSKLKTREKEIQLALQKEPQKIEKKILVFDSSKTEPTAEPKSGVLPLPVNSMQLITTPTQNGQNQTEPNPIKILETDKISSMQTIAGMKFHLLNFKDNWLKFFGTPQTNFFCVIHGMSGEGKTNFSMQFAKYLAENFGNVLYISGEEGFAPTFQQKIKSLGAVVPRLYAADLRTGADILNDVPNQYHFIIIDSLNNMSIAPEQMKQIRNKFKQSGIIAICQSTKDGKIRGSYEIVHESDITIQVAKGIAKTTKNRFKAIGETFNVFEAYRSKQPPK
jgi:hypothetical protein